MKYTEEESRQIAIEWFRFHQGKMDLSDMTDEEIKVLGREIDRKYKEVSEQGKREQKEREARMSNSGTMTNGEIRCPKCGSNQFAAGNKGFGLGKSAIGGLLLGPVGLLGGFVGSGQVMLSCLRCGNRWQAKM